MFLFFHSIVRKPQYILKDIFGLYKELQMVSVVEALINLGLSFVLVQKFGISGVLFARVIATLLTNFWYFPKFLYRRILDKNFGLDIKKYISIQLIYRIVVFLILINSKNYKWIKMNF